MFNLGPKYRCPVGAGTAVCFHTVWQVWKISTPPRSAGRGGTEDLIKPFPWSGAAQTGVKWIWKVQRHGC